MVFTSGWHWHPCNNYHCLSVCTTKTCSDFECWSLDAKKCQYILFQEKIARKADTEVFLCLFLCLYFSRFLSQFGCLPGYLCDCNWSLCKATISLIVLFLLCVLVAFRCGLTKTIFVKMLLSHLEFSCIIAWVKESTIFVIEQIFSGSHLLSDSSIIRQTTCFN